MTTDDVTTDVTSSAWDAEQTDRLGTSLTEPLSTVASLSEAPTLPLTTSESLSQVLDVVDKDGRLPPFPTPWRHPIRAAFWIIRTLFGLVSLILLLAVIAAIPLINFLALGYLLEVEGRVGRSGRIRDAFPLLNVAPRIGSIALGIWLWLLPLRLLSGAAADASIIDPNGVAASRLSVLLGISWLLITVHLCLALARGGALTCFVRPIKNLRWLRSRIKEGDYFDVASDHIMAFVKRLRLKHHFWLGVRGFLGALAWLIVPTAIFAATDGSTGAQVFTTVAGGALLAMTLAWVPFLQARLATEDRFRAAFALGEIRKLFAYSPFAWLFTLLIVYVLALPLYLFKAFVLPQDALWPITLIFIASIYPSRVITGWAYHRAVRRRKENKRSGRIARWTARLAMVPLLAAFVFLLHFTQFIGAHGSAGLFEHHAFLLPWPGDPTP